MLKLHVILLFIILSFFPFDLPGQSEVTHLGSVPAYPWLVNDLLAEGAGNDMFPGISVALYTDDSVRYFNFGDASLSPEVAVQANTKFQLGSIGKLITAIAVLQQVDQGKLDLHAAISDYVTIPGLESMDNNSPVTLHCLLTHSCGFNDANIGYMTKDPQSILPLEKYVEEHNPGIFQPPGTDIVYSNYSYALAGLIVEKISGKSFVRYAEESIFYPLGMKSSSLEFPYGYQDDHNYAKAYRKTETGFEEVELYPRHAIPAGSLVSTSEDMAMFIKALFIRSSSLLSPSSWEIFFTQQFTNHDLLNGYSYGLEHQNINGHESWAKGGMLPGMLSNVLIVPDEFAIFTTANTDDDSFGEFFYKAVFDKTLANQLESGSRQNLSTTKYAGVYRDKRYNRDTEENIVSLFRGQLNVYDNISNDTLLIYHNGEWHSYTAVEDGIFQCAELPYEYLVFKENDKGDVETLYRNLNIAGLSVPSSYEKSKWYNSPTFINEYYGFIPVFIFTGLLLILGNLFVRVIRIWKNDFLQSKAFPGSFYLLFGITLVLFMVHTYFVPVQILRNSQEFLFGYPKSFRIASLLGYLFFPLLLGLGWLNWKSWRNKNGSLLLRLYISLVEVSMIVHLGYMSYWNFF
jgi:CubicO group peptidase (beta-lactamase class C family)